MLRESATANSTGADANVDARCRPSRKESVEFTLGKNLARRHSIASPRGMLM